MVLSLEAEATMGSCRTGRVRVGAEAVWCERALATRRHVLCGPSRRCLQP